jgi:hypothetical protein
LELIGYSSNDLDRLIGKWQEFPEPFFLRFGDSVLVTSREDAWYLLGDYVSDKHLQQFGDLAILVLEEDNPALELEPDQRWMASIYGKRHSMSGELRKSLVETLAIMATCPTVSHPAPSHKLTSLIEKVVEAVLPPRCDWNRWASLRSHFGVLAEAVPDLFLRRIEEDLRSATPAVPQLFLEQTGGLSGGWMHCELLWALESLAWSGDYLSRVSAILAKLSSLVTLPKNYGNQPGSSLREIFLLWLPHTNATIDERVAALKRVLVEEPAVGWKLLLDLLPAGHTSISHPTSMPRWRPWADGWSRDTVDRHRYDYAMALAVLAFDTAADHPQKWSEALEGMLRFNDEVSRRVIASLHKIADRFEAHPNDAFTLWSKLRSVVQLHQEYEDAEWAFPNERIADLIAVRDRLAPTESVLKSLWLFRTRAELPGLRKHQQVVEHDTALEEARRRAVRDIYDASGSGGVWRLIELGADPHILGFVCGRHGLLTAHEARLPQSLTDSERNIVVFARSYVYASYCHKGAWEWINSLNPLEWSSDERARLALSLPFEPSVWDWVSGQEKEVHTGYWSKARAFVGKWDELVVRRAVAELVAARRPFSAIDLVNFHGERHGVTDLIAEVLEAGLSQEASEDIGDTVYDIQKLIGYLQTDASFDRQRLARIEWGYLPFLEKITSETGPDTLVAAAVENPSFYAELIQCAYRSKNDSPNVPNDSDADRFRARRAVEFLDYFDKLPGMDENGQINSTTLDSWIGSVMKLSKESGHSEIAAHKIGQLIGRAIYPYLENTEVLSQLSLSIEVHGNEDLTSGFVNGILNSRGVTMRDPFDGGKREHDLAAKFGEKAKSIGGVSPTLAKCLKTIQSHYEASARHEDEDAARLRLGR